jgi:hypothetical protein
MGRILITNSRLDHARLFNNLNSLLHRREFRLVEALVGAVLAVFIGRVESAGDE